MFFVYLEITLYSSSFIKCNIFLLDYETISNKLNLQNTQKQSFEFSITQSQFILSNPNPFPKYINKFHTLFLLLLVYKGPLMINLYATQSPCRISKVIKKQNTQLNMCTRECEVIQQILQQSLGLKLRIKELQYNTFFITDFLWHKILQMLVKCFCVSVNYTNAQHSS